MGEDFRYKVDTRMKMKDALELEQIKKLPEDVFNIDRSVSHPKANALKKWEAENRVRIEAEIDEENKRVMKNMTNIPLGTHARIDDSTTVMRVPGGWIYNIAISNGHLDPSIVQINTVLVPEPTNG